MGRYIQGPYFFMSAFILACNVQHTRLDMQSEALIGAPVYGALHIGPYIQGPYIQGAVYRALCIGALYIGPYI